MEQHKRSDDDAQLEEHSLPGTNQAGKGPGPCEKPDQDDGSMDASDDQKREPVRREERRQD